MGVRPRSKHLVCELNLGGVRSSSKMKNGDVRPDTAGPQKRILTFETAVFEEEDHVAAFNSRPPACPMSTENLPRGQVRWCREKFEMLGAMSARHVQRLQVLTPPPSPHHPGQPFLCVKPLDPLFFFFFFKYIYIYSTLLVG